MRFLILDRLAWSFLEKLRKIYEFLDEIEQIEWMVSIQQ